MKSGRLDVYLGELFVCYFPSLFIFTWVEFGKDLETRVRRCGTDEVDDNFIALQGLALPILCHMTEQPMFNLVPFAGARRKMADLDFQPGLVTQLLQFDFPKTTSTAVAATAVGCDQQSRCLSMATTAQPLPPTPNRRDGKFRRVAADADRDPRFVVAQIVYTIGNRFAFAWIGKVMGIDFLRLAFGLPGLPWILEVSQGFLLLGVHRDRRLATPLLRLHSAVDVAKLRIPIRMRFSLACFPVNLQAVSSLLQQIPHRRRSNRISLSRQFLGQPPCTLAGPPKGRHGIASTLRFNQVFQRRLESRTDNRCFFAARSGASLSSGRWYIAVAEFSNSAPNCRVSHARSCAHHRNTAPTQRHRFDSRPASASAFRQLIGEPLELVLKPLNNTMIHHRRINARIPQQKSTPNRAFIYAQCISVRDTGKIAVLII